MKGLIPVAFAALALSLAACSDPGEAYTPVDELPSAQDRPADRLETTPLPDDAMHVPEATYLAWLMNYWDDDVELVIASYNGGQGYVRRIFEADFVAGDKDEFYREIDRSETREYLQRVYENLAVYRTLYPTLTDGTLAEAAD